jgi:hypothetical protein
MDAVGLDWQIAGFGNVSSRGETDMILRNTTTGFGDRGLALRLLVFGQVFLQIGPSHSWSHRLKHPQEY